jgi:hypothetical protein
MGVRSDFVAWLTAHQLRIVDDNRVKIRFNALQRDVFSLTAMMQLVVLRRLLGDDFAEATARLVSSASWDAGIFLALETHVFTACA